MVYLCSNGWEKRYGCLCQPARAEASNIRVYGCRKTSFPFLHIISVRESKLFQPPHQADDKSSSFIISCFLPVPNNYLRSSPEPERGQWKIDTSTTRGFQWSIRDVMHELRAFRSTMYHGFRDSWPVASGVFQTRRYLLRTTPTHKVRFEGIFIEEGIRMVVVHILRLPGAWRTRIRSLRLFFTQTKIYCLCSRCLLTWKCSNFRSR